MIHPSSTIMSSITRPPVNVARQTAVYFRRGAPLATRKSRHSSGSTFARRFRGGNLECIARSASSGDHHDLRILDRQRLSLESSCFTTKRFDHVEPRSLDYQPKFAIREC